MSNRSIIGKFIADLHWRTRKPEYRRENVPFHRVIEKKLKQVVAYGENTDIFVAGDVFDRARDFMDMWTFKEMGGIFSDGSGLYSIRGQHDMFHHNKEDAATTYNAVSDSCPDWFFPVFNRVVLYGNMVDHAHTVHLYGAGWDEEVPEPVDADATNILVWHKGLWHRRPMYPGQKDGNVADEAGKLAELGYSMVFSGDNHIAFDTTVGGVRFINLGAFTRNSVDLVDQQPRFAVLYSDLTVDFVNVGERDVFDMGRSDADKDRVETKDGFSDALAGGFKMGDSFKPALERAVNEGTVGELTLNDTQKEMIRDIINTI